jgi:ubiquinone/menaquinone biosynthesis C-methylase UbiE
VGLYSRFIFPRLLDWGLGTPEHGKLRTRLLTGTAGNVLEIGFGTGLNLPHYPASVTNLVALDSERLLPKRVAMRLADSRVPVDFRQMDASKKLPFETDSFDWVVTTWTLCSIDDVDAALAEMRRVLKPDARFLFLEHGRSDHPKTARRQDFINPLQRVLGSGCNANRPIDRIVRESGLDIIDLDRFLMPNTPRFLGEMYMGAARKPA